MLALIMPKESYEYYGSVQKLWTNVTIGDDNKIDIDVIGINKTATRLAESMMLEFFPTVNNEKTPAVKAVKMSWWMNKLSSWIKPDEVNMDFLGGNIWQHSINTGLVYGTNPTSGLFIGSFDAPVAAIGTRTQPPTPFIKSVEPLKPGDVTGFGYNLWNNIWNTNYSK